MLLWTILKSYRQLFSLHFVNEFIVQHWTSILIINDFTFECKRIRVSLLCQNTRDPLWSAPTLNFIVHSQLAEVFCSYTGGRGNLNYFFWDSDILIINFLSYISLFYFSLYVDESPVLTLTSLASFYFQELEDIHIYMSHFGGWAW